MQRDYDLIIYGATGFTGRLATLYMMQHGTADQLRIAIAGRNEDKLRQLQGSCDTAPGIIIADSTKPDTIDQMVQSAKVVVSFAGPFTHYGESVIAACCKYGTDYLDITGETPFIRTMIERYQALAVDSGARLVPFSGFDSVPADLCVYLAFTHAENEGFTLDDLCFYYQIKGGFNGGTLASAIAMAEGPSDLSAMRPNALIFDPTWAPSKTKTETRVYEPVLNRYSTPFFMSPINHAVVRRSSWLRAEQGRSDPSFQYQERLLMGKRFGYLQALTTNTIMAGFNLLSKSSIGRQLIQRLGPKPGEGPSEEVRRNGFFRGQLIGRKNGHAKLIVSMQRDGDPGNTITILLACESARLAVENAYQTTQRGFLTPSVSFGDKLKQRLEAVGFEFKIQSM